VEVLAAGPRALARRDAAMRAFGAFIEESHNNGEAAAEIPPVLTEVVVGGIYEVIYARMLDRQPETLPSLLPDIMYVWLAPFVGAVRAGAARAEAARRFGLDGESVLRVAPEHVRFSGDTDVF
ncbi:MAG: hypothetical protein WBD40_12745, partial [Tepidisphaeraceae bacterium]